MPTSGTFSTVVYVCKCCKEKGNLVCLDNIQQTSCPALLELAPLGKLCSFEPHGDAENTVA